MSTFFETVIRCRLEVLDHKLSQVSGLWRLRIQYDLEEPCKLAQARESLEIPVWPPYGQKGGCISMG